MTSSDSPHPRTITVGGGRRGQSHVVGVVLLLGMSVIAIGALTASIGGILDQRTGHADATRVSEDFQHGIQPVTSTGVRETTLSFGEGQVAWRERTLRLYRNGTLNRSIDAGALVYTRGDRRVAVVGGAVVRGRGENAWTVREPPITAGPASLVVGGVRLGETGGVGGTGGVQTTLRTNVSHRRVHLGPGQYEIAIETVGAEALNRSLSGPNATTAVRDVDGDGVDSVFVEYEGTRRAFLVIHDVALEVGNA